MERDHFLLLFSQNTTPLDRSCNTLQHRDDRHCVGHLRKNILQITMHNNYNEVPNLSRPLSSVLQNMAIKIILCISVGTIHWCIAILVTRFVSRYSLQESRLFFFFFFCGTRSVVLFFFYHLWIIYSIQFYQRPSLHPPLYHTPLDHKCISIGRTMFFKPVLQIIIGP